MQCTYAGIPLTGTPWQEGAGDVEWKASQSIEITPVIDAATPSLVGRKNLFDVIQFSINLGFESYDAAASHCATFIWSLPTSGTLVLNTGTSVLTYAKAVFSRIERQVLGEGLVAYSYSFTAQGPPTVS
tara:strand:+ start:93 stop:479 length:387 start_codon:yes stop_codon:yes gene_type:complete